MLFRIHDGPSVRPSPERLHNSSEMEQRHVIARNASLTQRIHDPVPLARGSDGFVGMWAAFGKNSRTAREDYKYGILHTTLNGKEFLGGNV